MISSNNKIYNLDDIINNLSLNGYKTFTDFTRDLFKNVDNGQTIDMYVPMYGCNIIMYRDISNFNDDFLRVDIDLLDDYIKMAKDSNGNFLDMNRGLFSVYNDFEQFPVARLYIYKFKSNKDIQDVFEKLSFSDFRYDPENLDFLIDAKNKEKRIKKYIKTIDDRFAKQKKYAEGKINNTSLSGAMLIAGKDLICSVCKKNQSLEIEEISYTNYETGILMSIEVCKHCLSFLAKENKLLNLIFHEMNLSNILTQRELKIEEIREISNKIVKFYLNAEIIKEASNTNDTITAIVKNKFLLKLRLTEISDYGYIILTLQKTELTRFDCASHHCAKVEFMPHHVHNNVVEEEKIKNEAKLLSRKKSKEHKAKIDITDSFLTGFLGIDYVAIKKKIEELDNTRSRINIKNRFKYFYDIILKWFGTKSL